jgi:hypothetical protein
MQQRFLLTFTSRALTVLLTLTFLSEYKYCLLRLMELGKIMLDGDIYHR